MIASHRSPVPLHELAIRPRCFVAAERHRHSKNVRCAVIGYGDGGAVTTRCTSYLSECEALSYMADRLRHTAVFE